MDSKKLVKKKKGKKKKIAGSSKRDEPDLMTILEELKKEMGEIWDQRSRKMKEMRDQHSQEMRGVREMHAQTIELTRKMGELRDTVYRHARAELQSRLHLSDSEVTQLYIDFRRDADAGVQTTAERLSRELRNLHDNPAILSPFSIKLMFGFETLTSHDGIHEKGNREAHHRDVEPAILGYNGEARTSIQDIHTFTYNEFPTLTV